MPNKVPKSFSLSLENAQFLDALTIMKQSTVVDIAITEYRNNHPNLEKAFNCIHKQPPEAPSK